MPEKDQIASRKMSADWLLRGALTKVGDTVDRLTGRRWTPSSSLATSELIERIKKLLDAEAKDVPAKGKVVPHNIKLKMQWDKFSTDSEDLIPKLEVELLTAAIDHINDSLYYTYAPVRLEVKADYFTEGVRLIAGFDKIDDEDREVELNVTVPAINVAAAVAQADAEIGNAAAGHSFIARYTLSGRDVSKNLDFPAGGRLSVGRTGENALTINDSSISKIHATLAADADGRLLVADTGSTNGTFINGTRISYGKANALEADDVVRFGTVEVRFGVVKRPVEPPEEPAEVDEFKTEKVAIEGFEFTSRISPETLAETAAKIEIAAEQPVDDEDKPAESGDLPK